MRELARKQRIKKILYSTPMLVLLFVVVAIFARGALVAVSRERETNAYTSELAMRAAALEERNAGLEGRITRLQTPEGLEEELRSRFSVAEEGERVVVIVDPKPEETVEPDPEPRWYKKWWNTVSGLWR